MGNLGAHRGRFYDKLNVVVNTTQRQSMDFRILNSFFQLFFGFSFILEALPKALPSLSQTYIYIPTRRNSSPMSDQERNPFSLPSDEEVFRLVSITRRKARTRTTLTRTRTNYCYNPNPTFICTVICTVICNNVCVCVCNRGVGS